MTWIVYQDTDSEADALLRYADVLVESEEIRDDLVHYEVRAHGLRKPEQPYDAAWRKLRALEKALEQYAEPRED